MFIVIGCEDEHVEDSYVGNARQALVSLNN